jgi:phage tail-like protein
MAVVRDRPYSQFNFRVNIAGGPDEEDFRAGFQEVSGLGMEVTVAEYRGGNHKYNSTMKITGTSKVPDVTLKRGVIGDPETLFGWIRRVRDGSQNERRQVTIKLYSEDHETVVQEWELSEARPTKYTGPALTGKGTDVAVEELVLACERIEVK